MSIWFRVMLLLSGSLSLMESASASEIPRMASLKASEVNVRVGPGSQYPIVWMLLCVGLPVRIVAEFDMWRKIEDPLGTTGWVHKRLLSGRQTLFLREEHVLHAAPDRRGRAVAKLSTGVIVDKIDKICSGNQIWYAVKVQGLKGFIPQKVCWGEPQNEQRSGKFKNSVK